MPVVRRSAPAAVALVAVALLVAACAAPGKSTATAPTTSTTAAGRAARFQAFVTCMNAHGVAITNGRGFRGGGPPPSDATGTTRPTTPTTLPPGVTQQQYDSALQACRSLLPTQGGGFGNNPAFAVYRNCLVARGVTLPTPGQGAGAGGGGIGALTNSTDPTVQAALKACANLRPAGGLGGQGGTTTTATS